jgi:CelD/BcsL family acetyltransferase involved in cellulose biosynthesis
MPSTGLVATRVSDDLEVEPLASPGAVGDLWDALALRSGSVFATREWASAWWRHHGDGQRPLTTLAHRAGRPVAILPLCLERRGPVPVVGFAGHGAADELGPVCAPEDRLAALRAIGPALRAHGVGHAAVLAERLPGSGAASALGGVVVAREASPVARGGRDGWDPWLARRSANFRGQVRRRERRLERSHGLRFRLARTPAELEAGLDVLVALHAARWGDASQAFAGARVAFHREFALRGLARGWTRLWIAEAAGAPVAAWYGFRFAGSESFYQSGWDPAWEREAVGFVLLAHTMRAAFDDGLDEYRLLRGGEAYKARFATGDDGLETVLALPTPAGPPIARLAARAARRPRLRHALGRAARS